MSAKIFVTREIPGPGIALLKSTFTNVEVWPGPGPCPRELLISKCNEADGILTNLGDPINQEALKGPNLKVVSQFAVGTDNIDVAYCTSRHIPVSYTPGILTNACADHAWALMMAAARQLVQSNRFVLSGQWKGADPCAFLGAEFYGQTLGIIGPGRIGQAVAKRASGFDMKIRYYGPHQKPDFEATGAEYRTVDQLAQECDFIVLTCPLNDGTRGIIGINQFKQMKKSAIVVNIARGPCVVAADLATALKEGLIGGAALDVTDPEPIPVDHPLVSIPNCLIVSHIASATVTTRSRMSEIAAQGIIDALAGKEMQFCANPAYKQ
jgi:glyoxylate reductase